MQWNPERLTLCPERGCLKSTTGEYVRMHDVVDRIAKLEKALEPFAAMDRPGCDLKELACQRGIASDMTILTSEDFRRAATALGKGTEQP